MDIKGFLKSVDGLSANTKRVYEQSLWQLRGFMQRDDPGLPKDAEPSKEQIYDFLNKYKSSSMHRHKAAIRAYLEYRNPGEAWPFTRRQFPPRREEIIRYVPPSVVYQMMDATDNEDDRMYVYTLFMLGCRIHELMGIEGSHILEFGVQVLTKGGSFRLKRITKDFQRVLADYAQGVLDDYGGGKKGRVFPRTYTYYYKTLKKLGAAVGHPEVSPHMLRHARAVDLLRKGMKLPFVQQFLDHANINTTARYLLVTGGELGDVLEEVESGKIS